MIRNRKPSEYFWREVFWPESEEEPSCTDHDVSSLQEAQVAIKKQAKMNNYAAIGHRTNIVDVTPIGDPRGLLWDYDSEIVEEN